MNSLRSVMEILVRALRGVDAIILFGSRSRGDYMPWSDYDLLVIADFSEPYLERIKIILDLLSDVKIPIEPHPYTMEEALSILRKGSPILVDALEEGTLLTGAPASAG